MPHKCKIANAKYKREYYLKNKEKLDLYLKEDYLKNRDKKIARTIAWQKDNKEKYNKRCVDWARRNPEKRKNIYLRNANGITFEDYSRILKEQENCCAICKSNLPGSKKKYFCVDHCHSTNVIRGLLCDTCNKGLGHFRDNTDLLKIAIEYLKKEYTLKAFVGLSKAS